MTGFVVWRARAHARFTSRSFLLRDCMTTVHMSGVHKRCRWRQLSRRPTRDPNATPDGERDRLTACRELTLCEIWTWAFGRLVLIFFYCRWFACVFLSFMYVFSSVFFPVQIRMYKTFLSSRRLFFFFSISSRRFVYFFLSLFKTLVFSLSLSRCLV